MVRLSTEPARLRLARNRVANAKVVRATTDVERWSNLTIGRSARSASEAGLSVQLVSALTPCEALRC